MGIKALKSHAEGKKHKQLWAAVTGSLKTKPVTKSTTSSDLALIEVTKSITSSPDLSPVSSTSSSSGWHVTQKTLELTVTKLQTLSAEIRWALQTYWKGTPVIHQPMFHLYSK